MSAVREARASAPSVDAAESIGSGPGLPLLLLVGNPNVGKSVLFNALTGAYTTVSNYPGTSVEISRGEATIAGSAVATAIIFRTLAGPAYLTPRYSTTLRWLSFRCMN